MTLGRWLAERCPPLQLDQHLSLFVDSLEIRFPAYPIPPELAYDLVAEAYRTEQWLCSGLHYAWADPPQREPPVSRIVFTRVARERATPTKEPS